jgi:phosphohistidine phosphatase SixA
MNTTLRGRARSLAAPPAVLALCAAAGAAYLAGDDLVLQLQRGGCVILMRHASSPGAAPDPAQVDPGNVHSERQLDEAGRASARAMGDAFRRLRIPVGAVLSSPAYRALETPRLAGLAAPQTYVELGDAEHGATADPRGTRGAWLRGAVAQAPKPGTNTLIVTHAPNIREAFPTEGADLVEGEALIFRSDGRGGASLIARVRIEDWPRLGAGR